MPTEPEDSLRDALYPDDLTGAGRLVIREWAFYHARDDEDQESLPDDANEGWWLPVSIGDRERFIAAPEELRQELIRADAGEGTAFKVSRCERSGPEDHAPYEVDVALMDEA